MSNAMRFGKRSLAAVAAGALGAGMLVVAASAPAQAATVTADGPLRAGTIFDAIVADDSSSLASLTSTAPGQSFPTTDVTQLRLVSGPGINLPTSTALLLWDDTVAAANPEDIGGTILQDDSTITASGVQLDLDDSIALVTANGSPAIPGNQAGTSNEWQLVFGGAPVASSATMDVALIAGVTDDSWYVMVNNPGTYVFQSGAAQTSWSVTTTGAPATIAFTPTTQSVANQTGAAVDFTLEVLDASGNATQLAGSESIAVTSGDANLSASPSTIAVADLLDGSEDVTVTVTTPGVTNAGPKTLTATGNAFLGAIEGTATTNVIDVAATTNMVVTKPANAYDAEDGDGTAGDPYAWQIKPGVVSVEVQSTLSSSATTNEVNFTAYYDDTTSADIIGTGVVSAVGGKATFSTTVSPAQAVAGKEIYFYDGTKWLEAAFTAESQLFEVAPAAQVRAQTIGGTTSWVVGAGTQYGEPLAGWEVKLTTTSTSRNASKSITATTDATGLASIALPDTSTSTTNLTDAVTITVKLGTTQSATNVTTGSTGFGGLSFGSTVRYSSTGTVTLSQLKFAGVVPSEFTRTPVVPYTGAVYAAAGANTGTLDDSRVVAVTVIASLPGSTVTFTGSEGVGFLAAGNATQSIADGEATLDVVSDASSGVATAYYYSTKTGSNTVTATSSSGSELSGTISNISNSYAARNFQMTAPATATVGTIVTINVKITDGFGNPVTTFGEGPGYIGMQTDLGILAGAGSIVFLTNANTNGEATVALISTEQGVATVQAEGVNGQFGDAADSPITGFTESVYQGAVAIEWVAGPTAKAITITGERTVVGGRPGVMVDGVTVGFEAGAKVKPWIKFPGQTSYSEGTARPEIDSDGEFSWQRRTGKKIYVYFSNEDGSVKSDRIIIAAK